MLSCLLATCVGSAEPIPEKLLQEDFRILRNALEQAHGGIYRYTSRSEMDRTFDLALRALDRPMTDLEFWRVIAPVVARLKCGHTFLWFPHSVQAQFEKDTLFFPLEARVLAGRVYIYQDCATPGSPLEGTELLAINGISIKTLLRQLRSVMPSDGNTEAARDWRIGHIGGFTVYLHGLGIRSPYLIQYRSPDGKRRTAELAGLTLADRAKASAARNPSEPTTNADLKFLDNGQIALLTIRHWYQYADAERKLTFLDFLKDSFTQMQTNHSRTLIIDVRNNDGGLDAPGKQLFAFLWDQPFYYDDKLVINAREFDFFKYDPNVKPFPSDVVALQPDGRFHHRKHPNLGLQQPATPHFSGKVYVLMNGGSFSTSCEFLATLHYHKRGVFVGEEPAGGYYGCTAGRFVHVELPNSKLILRFGLVTYYQAVKGYKHFDRGVLPDHPVRYAIHDLIARRDKEMELALSLARKPVAPRR